MSHSTLAPPRTHPPGASSSSLSHIHPLSHFTHSLSRQQARTRDHSCHQTLPSPLHPTTHLLKPGVAVLFVAPGDTSRSVEVLLLRIDLHAPRLVCRVAGTGIFTAIAALMELKNTGNVKKACKIFAVGNTAALFFGPQTAERELKGHCTKKHIIPHLALGLNGLALAATLL